MKRNLPQNVAFVATGSRHAFVYSRNIRAIFVSGTDIKKEFAIQIYTKIQQKIQLEKRKRNGKS